MTPLNERQSRFVDEYVIDPNGTHAAIRAGYSPRTAESQASRLLRNAKVQSEINKALAARAERVQVTQDEVLRELKRLAMIDISEAFDEAGRLKLMKEMSPDVRRAIAGVDVTMLFEGHGENRYHSGDLVKLKLWDKVKALELLGKHLGMWTEKLELAGKNGGPITTVTEHAQSPDRIASILSVLERAGVVTSADAAPGAGTADDASDDAVHPPSAAPDPGGVPSP